MKVEEDAKKINLANEMYSNMISLKKQQETIQFGREESSKIDMSILRGVTAPKTPVPSTIKRKHVFFPFLKFCEKLDFYSFFK